MASSYLIRRTLSNFTLPGKIEDWDAPIWQQIEPLKICNFHPKSSDHHPQTHVRVLHDKQRIFLRFDVEDRYVISRATQFQQPVCRDSCVEFFVQPRLGSGYFNIEMNCSGALLMYYIEDPTRMAEGFVKYTPLTQEQGRQVIIHHSMPTVVEPEIVEPTNWRNGAIVPISLLEVYTGKIGDPSGQTWRANFYKCADESSHSHWGSWNPIGQVLNFHQPEHFGELRFE